MKQTSCQRQLKVSTEFSFFLLILRKNTVYIIIQQGSLKRIFLFLFEGHLHQRCERAGHRAEAEAGDRRVGQQDVHVCQF